MSVWIKIAGIIFSISLVVSCHRRPVLVDATEFDREINGKQVALYTFENEQGMIVQITNFGGRIVSVFVPDKNGKLEDVVLGFSSLEGYLNAKERYMGCVVGRVANRIAGGMFMLDSICYQLPLNDGGINTLHGGIGFSEQVWQVDSCDEHSITLSYFSPDGADGFPGNVKSSMTYRLTEDNSIEITYRAETDKTTPLSYTNHSYFNLSGEGDETITDQELTIYADKITPVDSSLIPTGEYLSVEGTPFDFRKPKMIGAQLSENHPQLLIGNGYNHNWVLKEVADNEVIHAATVWDPKSGRTLDVFTDAVGVQFYDASYLSGEDVGKSGKPYLSRGALALETQGVPSAVNRPSYPSVWVHPGEIYTGTCIYKFGIK